MSMKQVSPICALASLPSPPVLGCEGHSQTVASHISHLKILNLIRPAKSFLPFQVTLTNSRDEDLDVSGSQYSAASPAILQCDSHAGRCSDLPTGKNLPISLGSVGDHRLQYLELVHAHLFPAIEWPFLSNLRPPPKPPLVGCYQGGRGRSSCSQDLGLQLPRWADSRAGIRHRSTILFATGVPRYRHPKLRRYGDQGLALSPASHRDQQVGVGPILLLPSSYGYRGPLGSCPRLWGARSSNTKRSSRKNLPFGSEE